jgi:hypothetical protein
MSEDKDIFLAANLGSEVARLSRAREEHDKERMRGAYERACGILEELKSSTEGGGQLETAMLRTILDDLMQSKPAFSIRAEVLNAYFLPFARKVLHL